MAMTRRDFARSSAATVLSFWFAGGGRAASASADRPPNVLVLLSDDQGWGDLGLNHGATPTPNLDRFFRESLQLTNFMTCPVCSPTRAGLLTGRHHLRLGAGPKTGGELDLAETTLAEALKAAGYATGVFGKWHNGDDPDTPAFRAAFQEAFKDKPNKTFRGGHGANAHGFDEAWVYYGGGADYVTRRTVQGRGPVSWWHNREFRPRDRGYTDDLITQHAIEFLRASRQGPFFCYVPFHLVHAPLQAKPDAMKRVPPEITERDRRLYSAMLISLDDCAGAILAELDRLGLAENTIVVFFSDNGAAKVGSNLPLRGGKHSTFEGGVHSPAAIRWPAGGLVGPRRYDGLMGHLDLYPTLLAMAGLKRPPGRPLDGKSLWPALREGGPSPVDSYYWVWDDHDVVRTADWKLTRYAEKFELFDIRNDLRETSDVASGHPDVVRALTAKLDAWREATGVQPMHLPPRLDAHPKAAPDGEVLEVRAAQTEPVRPRDAVQLMFAFHELHVRPGDVVEIDLCVAPDGLPEGFYYTPLRRGKPAIFNARRGVDQFGRIQARGPAPKGGVGVWERRVIGIGTEAPTAMNLHGLVLGGRTPGTFHLYLDNLRIRRADGTVIPVWTGGKDTRFRQLTTNAAIRDIAVRAVPAPPAGRGRGREDSIGSSDKPQRRIK